MLKGQPKKYILKVYFTSTLDTFAKDLLLSVSHFPLMFCFLHMSTQLANFKVIHVYV